MAQSSCTTIPQIPQLLELVQPLLLGYFTWLALVALATSSISTLSSNLAICHIHGSAVLILGLIRVAGHSAGLFPRSVHLVCSGVMRFYSSVGPVIECWTIQLLRPLLGLVPNRHHLDGPSIRELHLAFNLGYVHGVLVRWAHLHGFRVQASMLLYL